MPDVALLKKKAGQLAYVIIFRDGGQICTALWLYWKTADVSKAMHCLEPIQEFRAYSAFLSNNHVS